MPPISGKKRTKEIAIRVTEDELAKLKRRQQGTTMAGWMRGLGLGVTPMKPADPELVRALGRMVLTSIRLLSTLTSIRH